MALWDKITQSLWNWALPLIGVGLLAVWWFFWDQGKIKAEANLLYFLQDSLIAADPGFIDPDKKVPRNPELAAAIREFQHAAISKLTDLIRLNPRFIDKAEKIPRNANDVEAVEDFKKSLETDIRNVNKKFIGGVQTGTLKLEEPKKDDSGLRTFNIFAPKLSHVYLEFNTEKSEISAKDDIELILDNRSICSDQRWDARLSWVEFEVTDVSSRGKKFHGKCHNDTQFSSQSLPNVPEFQGRLDAPHPHIESLIAFGLRLVPHGLVKDPPKVELDDAATQDMGHIRDETTTSTGVGGVGHIRGETNTSTPVEGVTVSYIVIVSPLIEDTAKAVSENSAVAN